MNLSHYITRCLGLQPGLLGDTLRCPRRDTCARYTQRTQGNVHTPIAQWLCPGPDDFWQHYIDISSTTN